MKTNFKRILSLILTLCVLAASFTCFTSICASAEEVLTNIVKGVTADRVLSNGTQSGNPAVKAFDGKTVGDSNKWMAAGANDGTAWLIVDLGGTFDVAKTVTFAFAGNNGTRKYYYDIYVAEEGTFDALFTDANKTEIFDAIKENGTEAVSVDPSNTKIGEISATCEATGRYVLFQCTGNSEGNGTLSLFELEIYVKGDYSSDMPSSLIITCFGDSVTEGYPYGGSDKAYPARLQELLGSGYLVQNCGDGGERAADIMARQGSMRIYTENEITFAAGETQVLLGDTYRGFVCKDGSTTRKLQWTYPFGRDLPIDKVVIDGKTYTIKITDYKDSLHCKTYLVRSDATEAVTIPADTEAFLQDITNVSKNNYCDVYLMGFNGVYESIDHLVSLYQQAIDYGGDNYIIVLPYMDLDKNFQEQSEIRNGTGELMRKKFMEKFGDHVIDLVDYFADGGMEKAGFTPTTADLDDLASGTVPVEYRDTNKKGDVHLDANGYRILAGAVYDKGVELGYFGTQDEPPYAGDTSDAATVAAVMFISLIALAATSVKVLRKN